MKFLFLGSKSVQIFDFVSTLIEAALNVFKLLYLRSEIILSFSTFFWLAVWFHAFSTIIAIFASWKLLELLYIGFEHKLRIMVSSTSVQDRNRAAPTTFMMQNFDQPQIRFRTNRKFECFLSISLRNLNICYKLKKNFKKI